VRPDAQTVPSFTAVAESVYDGAGNPRRPAIRLSWDATNLDEEYGLIWQIRRVGETDPDLRGSTPHVDAGTMLVTEGILPSTDYEVRAQFTVDRAVDWTVWVSVTTPDTFLSDEDFKNGIYQLFKEQGLYAIRDVLSLPASGDFSGEKVFNRADGKLYEWDGASWSAVAADVPDGSITETKIEDNSISTPKLKSNSVVASKIAGGTITGDKIVANTITGGLLATSGIITSSAQITNAVITTAKIDDLSVNTIKIANGSLSSISSDEVSSQTGTSSWATALSLSPTTYGGTELLVWVTGILVNETNPGGTSNMRLEIEINGTRSGSVFDTFSNVGGNPVNLIRTVYVAGSSVDIDVNIRDGVGTGLGTFEDGYLVVTELKR